MTNFAVNLHREIENILRLIKMAKKTISELTPNNSYSNANIENANIPDPLFALNPSTDRLDKEAINFRQIANSFHNVLMMSHSDEETLMHLKFSNPYATQTTSKVRFADEAGPSTAPSVPATPSTTKTDTKAAAIYRQSLHRRF